SKSFAGLSERAPPLSHRRGPHRFRHAAPSFATVAWAGLRGFGGRIAAFGNAAMRRLMLSGVTSLCPRVGANVVPMPRSLRLIQRLPQSKNDLTLKASDGAALRFGCELPMCGLVKSKAQLNSREIGTRTRTRHR